MSRHALRSHTKNNSISLEDLPVVKMKSSTGKKKAFPLKQQKKMKADPKPKKGKVAPPKQVTCSEKAASAKPKKMVVSKKPIAAPPVVAKMPIIAPPMVAKMPIAAPCLVSKKPIAASTLLSKKSMPLLPSFLRNQSPLLPNR